MSGPVSWVDGSRQALFDFALAVLAWHEWPNDRSRQRMIDSARAAAATTGIPDAFEDFARSLEQQPSNGEGETR